MANDPYGSDDREEETRFGRDPRSQDDDFRRDLGRRPQRGRPFGPEEERSFSRPSRGGYGAYQAQEDFERGGRDDTAVSHSNRAVERSPYAYDSGYDRYAGPDYGQAGGYPASSDYGRFAERSPTSGGGGFSYVSRPRSGPVRRSPAEARAQYARETGPGHDDFGVPGVFGGRENAFLVDQAGGAGPHRGRGPKNYVRSDERIREDVSDRLADDGHLDASDIEVRVDKGEVTLSGEVPDRASKRRAEDCIEDVSGVNHIQNNLRVKAAGQPASGPVSGGVGMPGSPVN